MADQRIEKWRRWIDGPIKNNVLTMHLQRDSWHKVAALLEGAGDLPDSYWWEFMVDTYATTQAVAVRRQADTHKDVASLGKIIEEIRDDPTRLTRDFWTGMWETDDPFGRAEAQRQWTEHFGGTAGDHLDPKIPADDAAALDAAAATVKGFVDQHVAHADASAVSADVILTLHEIHQPIDVIGELFRRYYSLLTASSFTQLVPVIQHDWMAAFRIPWDPASRGQP